MRGDNRIAQFHISLQKFYLRLETRHVIFNDRVYSIYTEYSRTEFESS